MPDRTSENCAFLQPLGSILQLPEAKRLGVKHSRVTGRRPMAEPRLGLMREGTMTRIAHCSCGGLRVEVSADPDVVGACHCGECQRRTGSVFGVTAFFKKEHVRPEGPSNIYVRNGQEGRKVRMHFCPTCGATVFWEPDLWPDHFGVAVGAFHDTNFPPPTLSVWEESKHGWVAFACDLRHFQRMRT